MDKLKMHSMDGVAANIDKIGALFPNCVTETMKGGKVVRAIDFDMLRQELSDVVVEGPTERYQFTWPEKRKSVLASNAPITATLRPCRERMLTALFSTSSPDQHQQRMPLCKSTLNWVGAESLSWCSCLKRQMQIARHSLKD